MLRIFGPPGTGKTTTLLDIVDKSLSSGVPSQQMAFFAFTRKAANEAKERACARFGLDIRSDLPYFRTMHSLAFHLTGLKSEQLMQSEHYREIESRIGFELVSSVARQDEVDENLSSALRKESEVLLVITLARFKMMPLQQLYNQSSVDYTWREVDYVARALAKYKKIHGLYDYTDMLELFSEMGPDVCPQFKIAMLDEAQDLSPLQWKIAHVIDDKSERMYCAGDDDQAIYEWAGADVEHFINLPGGSEVLEQSYRIPGNIHTLAERISKRIIRRFPKTYLPRKDLGRLETVQTIENLTFDEGSWLILAQARYFMNPVRHFLKQQGYFFEADGHPSLTLKIRTALDAWQKLQKNEPINLTSVKTLYAYMTGNGVRVARGKKRILADADELFTFSRLKNEFGLLATLDMDWETALDKLPDVDRAYVNALIRRGEDLDSAPRIKLSTIHGAKGGEADNVVLFTDLTVAAEQPLETTPDSLHRVFYVAVTRTRENLFTVSPENFYRSYPL